MADAVFEDRREAGRRLAAALKEFRGSDSLIVAVPRGGVVVGAEVARELGAPLDVILARKLGAPYQPELAIGAVVSGDPVPLLDEPTIRCLRVPPEFIKEETARQ